MPEIRFLDDTRTQELINETKRRLSSGQTATYTELNKKVDKEEGKGLSTNDFTDDDKTAILNSTISSTSTTSPLTDSANGMVQGVTIYGRSRKSKNLLEITAESQTVNGVTFTVDKAAGTITANGTATKAINFYITPKIINNFGSMKLSGSPITGNDYSPILISYLNSDGNYQSEQYSYNGAVSTLLSSPKILISIYIYKDTIVSNLVFKPMICTAADYEADPTFEPYFEGIKSVGDDGLTVTTANSDNTLTTSAEFATALPLRGVSDTIRDKLTCTAESKQVETVCREVDLEAAYNWGVAGEVENAYYLTLNESTLEIKPYTTNVLLSTTKYQYVPTSQIATDKSYTIQNRNIIIHDNDYTDITSFKSSLSGVHLIYELATPITTPLTTAEISAFRSLKTYDGMTNITIPDDPEFELDYLKNSDNGQAIANVQKDLQGQIDVIKNITKPRVYAFYVDQNDSNPATCVHPYYNTKYGCDNLFYQNAYMDYEKDEFNYGSWEDFIKEFFKPCMLAYDGHVDYYLDPDDYETKLDGGTSDIKDMTYNGNVMVQIKTLYFKRWTTGGKYYCIISDKKLDKSFKAFAHHDIKGNVLDYIYRAAYDGSYDGTRLRSISGIDYHNLNALTANKIMSNTTRQQEINFAKANNDANEKGEGWNILHKAEWDLINDLLLLIGMSTNTRATFGNGNISSYKSPDDTGIIATGTMDKKGLFYGKNDNVSGVKVFGIEMPWGNIWKSCLGWILSANQHLVKMTPGNEDGSTATDYNLDGTGYVATGKSITANGYVSAFDGADTGFLPTAANGSATTYMCVYVWQNTAIYFALVGGTSNHSVRCGAFYSDLYGSAARAAWVVGAALSYKGLANDKTNE